MGALSSHRDPVALTILTRCVPSFNMAKRLRERFWGIMPRTRRPNPARQAPASSDEVVIPDRLYFRIGEVSKLTGTKPFVLRYWETEFPTLKPIKSKSGHRLYRRQDAEMVLEIKRLLYEKGFTIEGARRQLADHSPGHSRQKDLFQSAPDLSELKTIRRELQSILTMLSRKC